MTILNAGRRPPVEMPRELFGELAGLLQIVADGTASPIDYPAIGYLTACASLIGGKRKVRPYQASNWTEPCILWAAAVGDPSSRKSPALEAVIAPLRKLETDAAEIHKNAIRDWETQSERAKVEYVGWQEQVKDAAKDNLSTPAKPENAEFPIEPVRRRTVIQDATPESMAAILAGNPSGTLHFRDELAGWLQSFERYSSGGREFWLEAYGGRKFVVDRKGAKAPIEIDFNGVSVIGGIQPDKLATLLASPDDGLIPRFLWTWPDKVPYRRPTQIADIGTIEGIYRKIEAIEWGQDGEGQPCAVTLSLTPGAEDIFAAWEEANSEIDEDSSGLIKSTIGKMNGVLLRLALVAEYTEWALGQGNEPKEISAKSIEAAAAWIDDFAKPMAARVYGDASLPKSERDAAILARYIRKQRFKTINARDLKRSPHKSALPSLRTAQAMGEAIECLIDAGWLTEDGRREGQSHGRVSADYQVNPAIWGASNE
ncbi:DUF3987 domain-containing protein [Pontixanthobacter sp. CEM42]|uniref:DUF3987 domain-containing protein n=1 Tax=Pontixanthobacter sp. CEM42 TaxID=2792077 RepID=UPI001FD837D3|nr:DUF3987 domain-containing protein [Pontixanthobacter sp. CEM42]